MGIDIEWFTAAPAIRTLREAGMSETEIACVVRDIYAASVYAERNRVQQALASSLPKFASHIEIKKLIADNVQ